ncbi:MAG TPA: arsenate reductase (glutaredoxin) [Cyclobacteriaceae bacterium]
MVTIYHNPRCMKSRQTLALLEKREKNIEIIQYLKDTPDSKELEGILDKLDLDAEDIVRKGETLYKEKFKGKQLSRKQWIEALVKNPVLIERPIVVKGRKAVLGRPPENVSKLY